MFKRFSPEFVFNPETQKDFDHESYALIYPQEFIEEIAKMMKVEGEENIKLLRSSIINSASIYESQKRYVLLRHKPSHKEKAALEKLASKAVALREAYEETLATGNTMFSCLFKCDGQDFHSNKHPRSLVMFQQMFESGVHYIGALPGFLSIIEEMALYAAPRLEEGSKKTKASIRYSNWVANLSEVILKSGYTLTQGKFDNAMGKTSYSSPLMQVLTKIMKPLDPEVTEAQIAEGIKEFRRQAKREDRW